MSEAVAREALKHWGLHDSLLTLIAQRENIVYRVENKSKTQTWALRIHRPGLRNPAELTSESQWLNALSISGLCVPVPVATEKGEWCVKSGVHWVDMQKWLPGETINHHSLPDHYRSLGQTMAHLHTVSDNWSTPTDFERLSWGIEGLVGSNPVWGPFWENPALDNNQTTLLRNFRLAAEKELHSQEHKLDFGLIHADLVSENILIHQKNLYLIDFDDSGFGFRLFELATVILRLKRKPDREQLVEALIEGYAKNRTIEMGLLNLFLALRACTYIGWIIQRREEKGGDERCSRFINNGCLYVERWLNSET